MMRRYLIYFAVSTAITLVPAALLSAVFEPINGDLTRTGNYSEWDYGWNSQQPALRLEGNGASITRPDVIVLGDSFSRQNVWQSALASQLKMRILSFHYAQAGCIQNWIEYALDHPSADTVAIQVVERDFVNRFRDLPPCKSRSPVPIEMSTATSPITRPAWPPEFYVVRSYRIALNTVKITVNPDVTFHGTVINAPIKEHCAKFSNRRSDRILYYPDDELKLGWTNEDKMHAISNVISIQQMFAARGKKLVFIISPDKLSVYQECLANDPNVEARKQVNVTQSLIQAGGNVPNLIQVFQEQAGKMLDLYYPNDTHLSIDGNILAAETLAPFFTGKPTPALKAK